MSAMVDNENSLPPEKGDQVKNDAQKEELALPPPSIDEKYELYKPTDEENVLVDKFLKEENFSHLQKGKVIRFLRARKLNEDAAKAMLQNHVDWTARVKPYELRLQDVNQGAVDSGCWRYLGKSEEGCPILEVRLSLWYPNEYSLEEYEVYVSYFVSMSEREMERNSQFIVIFDMEGWAFWHAGYLNYIKGLVDIAQNQLPDRLRKVLLINTPFIFRATWAIISPWLDPLTAAKVQFVVDEKDNVLESLQIDKKLVPERYGGIMPSEIEEKLPIPGFSNPMI